MKTPPTHAQRTNARQDKIYELALKLNRERDAAKQLVERWPRRDQWSETWWRLHPELVPSQSTDEKTVAERKWTAPLKPKADQKACNVGLFSDDSKQTELF